MRSTFEEFNKELSELRALVASIDPVNEALAEHHDSVVRRYLNVRRRFDYAAFIVALYSSFEKFSEDLILSFARLATQTSKYEDLPPGLKIKHKEKSADILARRRVGEGRYSDLLEIDIVKNLWDCLSGATTYSLNDVAIVAHDLNLRTEELNKLFGAIGIEHICERARRADALLSWFCSENEITVTPQNGVPATTIKQRLDNLVERRNQVTHRGGNPLELIGTAEMGGLLNFVEALVKSMFSLTVADYLRSRYSVSTGATQLKLVAGPLKKNTVVIVEKPSQKLYVGQAIFTLVESTGARWGRIQSLQVNDVAQDTVETTMEAEEIGIGLDFKCPKDGMLILLDDADDVVWSPEHTDTPPLKRPEK